MKDESLKKIRERNYTVGVVGLGYVGLPLLWTFHKQGFPVLGFDIDQAKIDCLKEGTPYIKHLGEEMMGVLSRSERCDATTDFERLSEADAILMCVPTPLDSHREPDMRFVEQTSHTVADNLRRGQLVILESTTWPGTTEELIIPILEKESGLSVGSDFFVAYSPEREDPGNADFNTAGIPKVVGANSPEALELAQALYDSAIVRTVPVSDTRTAEAVKLTENIFRSVNIALVNELKVVYERMDIDVHEVLEAAATKPFGFMKFTPGPGLGGHCIPIDPFYLTWKAREFGINTRFIELSGEVNTAMPQYVVDRVLKALNTRKKSLNGSKVLVVGLAYKPDVDDVRESPSFVLMDLLDSYGAQVDYYDPHVSVIGETREHAHWAGKASVGWNSETIAGYDALIIATNHSEIDYGEIEEWADLIIDTRNAMKINGVQTDKVWKA
mgnify:CR=1 FL=1